jgi:hypothetical protein
VLEVIAEYSISLSWVPKGILDEITRIGLRFLWSGSREKKGIPLVKWKRMAIPKAMECWGLKNIFIFWQLKLFSD